MPKLNDEQRKLVEDHLYMVRYIVFKRLFFEFKQQDVEDYIQIGSIGLCNAALTFRADLGLSFKTYAYRCIRNEIGMERRRLVTKKRALNVVSFDQSTGSNEDDPAPCDFIADQEDVETATRFERLNRMVKETHGREGRIIRRYIAGYTQDEIGRSEGVSQSYSSRLIRRFRRRVEQEHMSIA